MTFKMIGGLILATIPIFVMVGVNIYLTEKEWERKIKEIGKYLKVEGE